MPSTTATIKHRTQITGTNNPAIQISKNPWNDSELIAGGSTGGLFSRDSGQTDGWGLVDAVASGQVLTSAGTSTLPAWSANPAVTSVSCGTNPASAGAVRLANNVAVNFRNAANSADVQVVILNGSNQALVGTTGANGPAQTGLYAGTSNPSLGVNGASATSTFTWTVNNSGHLVVDNNNVYDIGTSSTSPKDLYLAGKPKRINSTTTAGMGVSTVVAAGRAAAVTSAQASLSTFTVGASDGSFVVSANVLVTTATSHNFTVTCAYTDEGNTARTVTLTFRLVASPTTLTTAVANANGAVPYQGDLLHIRCKASTTITIATTGTFTTVTYNAEGMIRQVA